MGEAKPPIHLRFDRGTIELSGSLRVELEGALWDPRSMTVRAAAYRFGDIVAHAEKEGRPLEGDLRPGFHASLSARQALELRPYQREALRAWDAFGGRGVVALATGAGKTRIAIAAILRAGWTSAILVPTRALAAEWIGELARFIDGPVGLVGDGERRVEAVTVLTFESAYRHMDALGGRFGLLVVDEVHHFGSGARIEALECCAAPLRLGLTATAPPGGSEAGSRLVELVGKTVFDMGYAELAGTHLAPVRVVRIPVSLEEDEREEYARATRAFNELSRAFFRLNRGADFASLLKALGQSVDGRRAVAARQRAEAIASFPRAKRALVTRLLDEHRTDKTLVFTAFAENAYDLALANLIPVIAAETSAKERADILRRFREGPLRAIVSARVLNEGIDVPDARIAVIVSGTLGEREHVQRIGRVLRPKEGKEALVYELVTASTSESRKAWRRRVGDVHHAS